MGDQRNDEAIQAVKADACEEIDRITNKAMGYTAMP
jgi:hypothetical protein